MTDEKNCLYTKDGVEIDGVILIDNETLEKIFSEISLLRLEINKIKEKYGIL